MPYLSALRVSALLILVSLLLLLCVAGCVHNAPPSTPNPAANNAPVTPITPLTPLPITPGLTTYSDFVGDQACADCHAQEFRDHQGSHHAITLRAADRISLGELAPKPGPLPNSKARILQQGDGYQIQMPGGGRGPLQYALGSGKSGMTYVTLMGSHVFEMRASYFPNLGKWKITPGQTDIPKTVLGVDHKAEEARSCIQCHVTTLPPDSNVPEKRFFGVGCEACHGAGGAHVAAMRSGKTADIQMERIGKWDAQKVNDLCGKCHRNAEVAGIDAHASPDLSVTSRFQPYALMLSRCFKESKNTLSCDTCHNPHQNTSHDMRQYEVACLSCHGGKTEEKEQRRRGKEETQSTIHNPQSAVGSPNTEHRTPNTICPVNPRTGCVGCHMPRKPMLDAIGMSASAPDHFIRVRRPALEAKWAREAAKAAASMSMGTAEQ